MTCDFCSESVGLDRCDWPVMDLVPMRFRDVQVGDLVRRFNDDRVRQAAEVVEIRELDGQMRTLVLAMPGKNRLGGQGPRLKLVTGTAFAAIRIKRDTRCGRVCCFRHRAERGAGGVCCVDHWKAWEKIA